MDDPAVIVFARAPERGRVKTRLAASVGDAEALATHIELLEHALEVCAPLSRTVELCVAGDRSAPPLPDLAARFGVTICAQSGVDLGARMHEALARHLDRSRPALVVGSDIPTMRAEHVRSALSALRTHDVVVGPSEDGGYWSIGLARDVPRLFVDIPWGTSRVMTETRKRATGLRLREVATLWDVDTVEDWRRWRQLRSA